MNIAIAVPADPAAAHELLNSGRRIARTMGAHWIALLIRTNRRERKAVASLDRLVTSLGGELRCIDGVDVAEALTVASAQEAADVLVIGASRRPRLLRRIVRGTTEKLLRARRSFDLIIAASEGRR